MMALFGAPVSYGNDASNAVAAAIDMLQALAIFNAKMLKESGHQIEVGIGLNTGPVVVGYMGSSKSMEYTAIGDHVNLAARLCSAATPGQILITADTMRRVGHQFRIEPLEPIRVKGKQHPVTIFQVMV
jgi:adenylate cyclase